MEAREEGAMRNLTEANATEAVLRQPPEQDEIANEWSQRTPCVEVTMLARIWHGEATVENADAYRHHVTERVFPELRAIPGHRGAWLLRREEGGRVSFLVVTLWESLQAVRQFAGDDPERAVVEPEARAVLAKFDDRVQHYEVVSERCE
jgi:heme-degrading monooxygenase HmoA